MPNNSDHASNERTTPAASTCACVMLRMSGRPCWGPSAQPAAAISFEAGWSSRTEDEANVPGSSQALLKAATCGDGQFRISLKINTPKPTTSNYITPSLASMSPIVTHKGKGNLQKWPSHFPGSRTEGPTFLICGPTLLIRQSVPVSRNLLVRAPFLWWATSAVGHPTEEQ